MLLTRHLGASPGEIRRGDWTARAFLGTLRPPLVDGVLDPRDPGRRWPCTGRIWHATYLIDKLGLSEPGAP